MIRQSTSLLLASMLAIAGAADSATFTLTPVFSKAYEPTTFVEIPNFDPTGPSNVPVVLQVDFWLSYEGSEGTFGAIVFDVEIENLSQNPDLPGWQANNPSWENFPSPGFTPFYVNNGDLGIYNDLKFIMVGIASRIPTTAQDLRLMVGLGKGIVVWDQDIDIVGNMFLDWDGTTPAEVSVSIREAGYRRPSDGLLFVDPNPTFVGNTLRIGPSQAVIPEPASLALLSVGVLALRCLHRGRGSRLPLLSACCRRR